MQFPSAVHTADMQLEIHSHTLPTQSQNGLKIGLKQQHSKQSNVAEQHLLMPWPIGTHTCSQIHPQHLPIGWQM